MQEEVAASARAHGGGSGPGRDAASGVGVVALGIMCKAPRPGVSKTRLAASLGNETAAGLAARFIADVAATVERVTAPGVARGYAVFAPLDGEEAIRALVPASFGVLPQLGADLGAALRGAMRRLLAEGHAGAVLINADSPTLPPALLERAVAALRQPGERLVLGPAADGGYTLIGLKEDRPELFSDIPWSTSEVLAETLHRAAGLNLAVELLPAWYDVDDLPSLRILQDELAGRRPGFAEPDLVPSPARATAAYMTQAGLIG